VFLCRRVANLPGNQIFGVEHWWIKTPGLEAGMGPAQGGVPGHGGSDSPYVTQTAITEHAGEGEKAGSTCEWVGELNRFGAHQWAKVDRDCVERELQIGRPTGRWTPLNQCQSTIEEALDKCSPAVTFEPKYLGLGVRLDSDGIIRQYGGPKL
jgi:hypothetical protein